jgi:hypothetical protein
MFYTHTGDKLFPKYIHKVLVYYQGDSEPTFYEMQNDEREAIFNCVSRFYPMGEIYINLSLAKEITFHTYIWGVSKLGSAEWLFLDQNLLDKIYSDEGQTLLLKRSMNVPD